MPHLTCLCGLCRLLAIVSTFLYVCCCIDSIIRYRSIDLQYNTVSSIRYPRPQEREKCESLPLFTFLPHKKCEPYNCIKLTI